MTCFDRAADFYDETRRVPPEAMEAFIAALRDGFGPARSVLEIGVGTGRVAVPLAESGLRVTGVDISERMLGVLRSKTADVEVHVADATDLPFDADRFDAGLAVHVFHLIPRWQVAVSELVRVVRPGGRIVCPWQVPEDNPLSGWEEELLGAADVHGTLPAVGAASLDAVHEELSGHGVRTADAPPIPFARTTTLRDLIDGFESGRWSRYWRIADDVRAAAAGRVRAIAVDRGADLDAEHVVRARIQPLIAVV